MPAITGRKLSDVFTNSSGGALAKGDTVIVNTGADRSITTTTTGQAEVTVGVVIEENGIAAGATGRVLLAGYAPLVNVPASVTRGHYIETHTVAKQATGNATRRAGSFGQFLTGGTTPTAWLWGATDQTATGSAASYVGAKVYNSTTQSINNSTETAVTFDNELWDTDAIWDAGDPTKFTIPAGKGGKWRFSYLVSHDTVSGTGVRYAALRIDGTTKVEMSDDRKVGSTAVNIECHRSTIVSLTAGQYVEVIAFQNSGSSRNIGFAYATNPSVSNAFECEFLG